MYKKTNKLYNLFITSSTTQYFASRYNTAMVYIWYPWTHHNSSVWTLSSREKATNIYSQLTAAEEKATIFTLSLQQPKRQRPIFTLSLQKPKRRRPIFTLSFQQPKRRRPISTLFTAAEQKAIPI